MSTSASHEEFKIAVDSLSSVTNPQATYWYQTVGFGNLIIWDQDDYEKFCINVQEKSVMISLEGWVYVEKVVRLKPLQLSISININGLIGKLRKRERRRR